MKNLFQIILTVIILSGSVFAQSATVTIIREPIDVIGCEGEENRITGVLASSGSPTINLEYQWMKDGEDLVAGQLFELVNESGLLFEELMHEHSGIYTCDVWAETETRGEAIRTEPTVVYVQTPPEILVQPQTVYVNEGETAVMSVDAHVYGELPPDYEIDVQWYLGNTPLENNDRIAGAQTNVIKVSDITSADFGAQVWCTVGGYCGMSSSATVSIMEAPNVSFTQDVTFSSSTYCAGDDAMAMVEAVASNGDPISYQWYLAGAKLSDGTNIMGSNSATLTWRVEGGTTYDLSCEARLNEEFFAMSMGSTTTNETAMVTDQPMSVDAKVGESATFSVGFTGTDPVTVAWFNTSDTMTEIGNDPDLVLTNLTTGMEGEYYAVVTNDCGFDISESATLTVTQGGAINLSVDDNKFQLSNSPNPFDSQTTIEFNLVAPEQVRLILNDAFGNQIAELENGLLSAGTKTYPINADALRLSSGSYFYTLIVGNETITKQLVLVR